MKSGKEIFVSFFLYRNHRRLLAYILIFISCNNLHENKETSLTMDLDTRHKKTVESQNSLTEDSVIYKLDSIDTIINIDSIKNENMAFDNISFTMNKSEVNRLNKSRQQLGKYQYNFTYSFNGKGELYTVYILSDPEKAINYEEGISGKYNNLYSIISSKHGKPKGSKYVPSIFDVMNAEILWINTWAIGYKKIKLGIREKKLDSYDVVCKIVHIQMEKAENKRLNRLKNKNILDASEKF